MGFNSPSLNPENVQVQYLQKIATQKIIIESIL